MMIKTAIHHANTQNQELEETQDVEKLRQILPEPTYELSDAQKLKTSILAAVQQDEMSLQELKADLKLLGFKEIDIVTAIYKLNTNGFIVVDRDSAVTMVKCIYPFDA
jgi:hypothetical protein